MSMVTSRHGPAVKKTAADGEESSATTKLAMSSSLIFNSRRRLRGKISPSLLRLQNLNYLDLSYNDFGRSPIPSFIGSLTKLKHLDLSLSALNGSIPSQLGNLSNLNYLALSNPSLSVKTLEWLSELNSLKVLYMNYVDLRLVKNWVGVIMKLPSLSQLSLSFCQLQDDHNSSLIIAPSSTSITDIDLSFNNLTSSVYNWLFDLSNSLVNLSLTGNQLMGPFPEALGNMASLSNLVIVSNKLEGQLPSSLGNLCKLRSLYLGGNMLSGNLEDLINSLSRCAAATLEELDAADNNFTGSFPESIGKFSSLKRLFFLGNRLNGSLTASFGKLVNLEFLGLSSNFLEGVVSEVHFSSLPKLMHLDLSLNSLTINFSTQWVPLLQLEYLDLSSCNLGRFPNWLRTQKNMYYLDIGNASISDTIPTGFWGQFSSRLNYLNFSSNQIVENLPPDFSSKFDLNPAIDLSSNNFEGSIPPMPSSVTSLDLSRNNFSGGLTFLCQINDGMLTFLDLSYNLLTGELPECLSRSHGLVGLSLGHNKLFGTIPPAIGYLYQLETLNLYNNSFFGEMPLALSNNTRLSFLDLGANMLSGNVPAWLGTDLAQLYALNLRSNRFSGTIPSQLCHLQNLRIFDLSKNNLSGSVPSCLTNFSAMVHEGDPLERTVHRYVSMYLLNTLALTASFSDYATIGWQGHERVFDNNLRFMKSIDLSSNKLSGQISDEISSLLGLVMLNLSKNQLDGALPERIGQLKSLLVLNLSRNRLSGRIPVSMSELNSLGYLDLSYNNLSARIPLSTQLQSFDISQYTGNDELCGPPLRTKCPGNEVLQVPDTIGGEGKDEF